MKLQVAIATCYLVLGALALPEPAAAPACKQDSCQRAASRTRADCSSFLATTVVPCPRTTSTQTTVTRTAPRSTITSTRLATREEVSTQYATRTQSATYTSIITDTSTTFITWTSTESTTVTTTVATSTATITVTPNAPSQTRRAMLERNVPRAAVACPTTSRATRVPAYASACGATGYSSACSCLGVGRSTTTLPARTVTQTSTVTRSTTPPPATATVTSTAVRTRTTTALTTTTTTVSTVYSFTTLVRLRTWTVTTTTTTTETATAQVFATAYACPLRETQGRRVGQYVTEGSVRPVYPGTTSYALGFTSNRTSALFFYLDPNLELSAFRQRAVGVPASSSGGDSGSDLDAMYLENGLPGNVPVGRTGLRCSFATTDGTVSCRATSGANNVFIESSGDADEPFLLFGEAADLTGGRSAAVFVHDCPPGTERP